MDGHESGKPGPRSPDIELAETFADIARSLLAQENVTALLRRITTVAVETIDGCDHADISLIENGRVVPQAATDDIARRVSELQNAVGEGPCLSAIKEHETYRIDNLEVEERWPAFAHRAAEETGVLSVLGFRLFADEDTMGALNLYSREPSAFSDDAEAIGSVFAAHAAVAMVEARHQAQFRESLESRDVIGQAKGIIMSTRHVSDDEAFQILIRASQHLNIKLRTVAAEVAETGTPPDE
jgi:transcriptional regulator with GAF, ATPase, and Fis domain